VTGVLAAVLAASLVSGGLATELARRWWYRHEYLSRRRLLSRWLNEK